MMPQTKVYTSYNLFFLFPFLVWLILGAVFQYYLDKHALFVYINSRYTTNMDIAMALITNIGEGIFIFPVLMLLMIKKEYRTWRYISAVLLANVGAFLFSQSLKSYFNYPRPLHYFQEAKWIHILPDWERYFHRSFPSGHTTAAFALFCFLALLLKPNHKGWGLFFFAMALLVAYSRIYLAAHFFTDVYAGSIIGVFFSILAISIFYKRPYLHKK